MWESIYIEPSLTGLGNPNSQGRPSAEAGHKWLYLSEVVVDKNELRRKVFDKTGGYCAYCGRELDLSGEWAIDHVVAKSRGGKNKLSNYLPSCHTCNIRKFNRNPSEFKEFIKEQIINKYDSYVSGYIEMMCEFVNTDEYYKLVVAERIFLDAIASADIQFEFEKLEL